MRTIEQLRKDFTLYTDEIDRCEKAKCYWALSHILLVLPDVCATLESDPTGVKQEVGDRYINWCTSHLPKNPAVSGADRYQMRNSLLHSGSTTPQNLGMKHHSIYKHFSYVDPETFDIFFHDTTNQSNSVLNIHVTAMADETKTALENWFSTLQGDSILMARVEQNIGNLTRLQSKRIVVDQPDGSQIESTGLTRSST
jgi:hypothetical protein